MLIRFTYIFCWSYLFVQYIDLGLICGMNLDKIYIIYSINR